MKKIDNFLNEYRMPFDIFKAIKMKDLDTIKRFKSQVKDLSHLGYTTLYFSLSYGNNKTLMLLLELGADPNQLNGKGDKNNEYPNSTYKKVIEKNNASLLKLMIKYGLDITQKLIVSTYPLYKKTILTSLDYAIEEKSNVVANILYKNNIKITSPMDDLIRIFKNMYFNYVERRDKPIIIIITDNINPSEYFYFIKQIKVLDNTFDKVNKIPEKNDFIIKLKYEFSKLKTKRKFNI